MIVSYCVFLFGFSVLLQTISFVNSPPPSQLPVMLFLLDLSLDLLPDLCSTEDIYLWWSHSDPHAVVERALGQGGDCPKILLQWGNSRSLPPPPPSTLEGNIKLIT